MRWPDSPGRKESKKRARVCSLSESIRTDFDSCPAMPRFVLEGVGLILLTAWLFYHSWIAVLCMLPLVIPWCRMRLGEYRQQKGGELSLQFCEALASLITSMRAGYSVENAVRECLSEMRFQYGADAVICRELAQVETGLDNRIPVEKLFQEFAARAQIEEIDEFAQVFSIAKRSGGNMTDILSRTSHLIAQRIEAEEEIAVMLSSRRMEQKIMSAVPYVIILYISLTNRGFFDVLYHSAAGVLFMTVCLSVYIAACLAGRKISEIHL